MKIYLDDIRPCPVGWTLAKTAAEAIALLEKHGAQVEAIALDHDLEPEHYARPLLERADLEETYHDFRPSRTGYDVAAWMVEHEAFPDLIVIHTMNPVGRGDMLRLLSTYAPNRCRFVCIPGFRRGFEFSLE